VQTRAILGLKCFKANLKFEAKVNNFHTNQLVKLFNASLKLELLALLVALFKAERRPSMKQRAFYTDRCNCLIYMVPKRRVEPSTYYYEYKYLLLNHSDTFEICLKFHFN